MAVWSVVNLKHCGRSMRLDAEYYRPHLLKYEASLERVGWPLTTLGNLVTDGYRVVYENTKILDEDFDPSRHVKFMQAADIMGSYPAINQEGMGWVTIDDWFRYPQGRAKRGEILVEVKGKAEKAVIVPDDFPENVLVTGTLYKMLIDERKANHFFVFVYLLSRLGRNFRDRGKTNTLISYVNKEDLYDIPIPIPPEDFQSEIEKAYKQSTHKYELALQLYADAEALLLQALGLDQLDLSPKTTYTALFSEAFSAGRLDSEYFHPEKEHILEQLAQLTGNRVGDYFHLVEERLNPELGNDKNVYNYDLTGALRYFLDDDIQPTLVSELGSTKVRFQTDDVVVSRLRSYLREIAVVCTPQSAFCVGSSEFYVLRSKGWVTPELLLVYLRSDPVQKILKWCQKGSNHPRFDEREIITLKLPDNILEKQNEVTTLVQNGIEAYREAKRLLEEAKHRVEQMILGEGA